MEWTDFYQDHSLDFRSACNAAADPKTRPLGKDVFEEIEKAPEAAALFESVNALPIPEPIFNRLASDPRWRTLVEESIARVQRRKELQKTLWERCQKWFTTAPSGGTSPLNQSARTATAAVSAALAIPITLTLADQAGLTVPVAFTSKTPVQIEVTPRTGGVAPIPIEFTYRANQTLPDVPVRLTVTADSTELPVRLAAADVQGLAAIGKAVGAAATSVAQATATVTELKQPIADVRAAIQQTHNVNLLNSPDLAALANRIERVETVLREDRIGRRDIERLATAFSRSGDELANLNSLASQGRTIITLAVEANSTKEVEVDWPDENHMPRRCTAVVEAGEIGQKVSIRSMKGTCSGNKPVTLLEKVDMRPGDVEHIKDFPLALALDSVQRPLFSRNYAMLRILHLPDRAANVQASLGETKTD